MNTNRKPWALAFSAFAFILATTPGALATCGSPNQPAKHPSGLELQSGQPQLVPAAVLRFVQDETTGPSIVGMWHTVFTQETVDNMPVPHTVFDNTVSVWHSDGTEVMNSSRPAQDGNFCLGVWTKTGVRQYYLNHIPWQGNDPNGNPQDGAQILERVTLSTGGNHYVGSFKFYAYDSSGNRTVTITGSISATRITTNTPFSSLL